jgi:anti-sigma factor RsiW
MTHLGEHLTDFVFGELSASEMEEARRHVAACADCRKEVEQFEGTRSLLKMAPDTEPPRHIVFEFEKRRSIWTWLVPAAVAAALIIAVLIAAPMQIQWRDSQLTLSFGKRTPPVAVVSPAVAPQPAPQPIDYDRIAKQVESSERAWLVEELKKHDAQEMKQIRLSLQGNLAYLQAQQQRIEHENVENAATIQRIAQRSEER